MFSFLVFGQSTDIYTNEDRSFKSELMGVKLKDIDLYRTEQQMI